jgi:hypothetical protein
MESTTDTSTIATTEIPAIEISTQNNDILKVDVEAKIEIEGNPSMSLQSKMTNASDISNDNVTDNDINDTKDDNKTDNKTDNDTNINENKTDVENDDDANIDNDIDSCVDTMAAVKLSPENNCAKIISPTSSDEDFTIEIKDVTDYSKPSPVKSVDLEEESSSLLRGWGSDQNGNSTGKNIDEESQEGEENNKEKALKALKKASVAITGTALVVAGIPMIPMPTPGGVVVTGSGLALLATEFPAAQRILDKGRDGLENMVGKEEDDESDSDSDDDSSPGRKKGYTQLSSHHEDDDLVGGNDNDEDESMISKYSEDASLVSSKSSRQRNGMSLLNPNQRESVDEVMKNARKTGKRTKKNLKNFVRGTVLPLMSKITTPKDETSDSETSVSPKKKEKATEEDSPKKRNIVGNLFRLPSPKKNGESISPQPKQNNTTNKSISPNKKNLFLKNKTQNSESINPQPKQSNETNDSIAPIKNKVETKSNLISPPGAAFPLSMPSETEDYMEKIED